MSLCTIHFFTVLITSSVKSNNHACLFDVKPSYKSLLVRNLSICLADHACLFDVKPSCIWLSCSNFVNLAAFLFSCFSYIRDRLSCYKKSAWKEKVSTVHWSLQPRSKLREKVTVISKRNSIKITFSSRKKGPLYSRIELLGMQLANGVTSYSV